MALTLRFLGKLQHVAGRGSIALKVAEPLTLAQIAERLDPELAAAIAQSTVRIALNGALVADGDFRAGDGDELAFLPPVSGG